MNYYYSLLREEYAQYIDAFGIHITTFFSALKCTAMTKLQAEWYFYILQPVH